MEWTAAAMTGFTIGLAFTAVPGPVTAEATRRAVAGGFWPGFMVNLGSCIGDVFWAVLGLSGAAVFLRHDAVSVALGVAGVCFLFSLARSAAREAFSGDLPDTTAPSGGAFRVGITFSFANPSGIAFWSGVGTGMLASLGDTSAATILTLIVAYLVAGMALGSAFCVIAATGGRLLGQRVTRWVNAASAVALTWFAVRTVIDTIRRARVWILPVVRAIV
jgi:L-lysine exporter family protein LysE/ArgO